MNHCLSPAKGGPEVQDPREVSLGCQGHPQCHDFHIWSPWHVICDGFQKSLADPSGVIVCSLGTCACCSGGAGYRRQKSLTRQWLW